MSYTCFPAEVQSVPVEILRNQFYQDNWVWDSSTKGEHVMLSPDRRAAYFHTDPVLESTGTAGWLNQHNTV